MPNNTLTVNFEREWQRAVEVAKTASLKAVQETCRVVLSDIVLDTPVKTGRARGNWQINIGGAKEGLTSVVDPRGFKAIRNINYTCEKLKLGEALFFSNNLPYIERLEYGWSKQSPQGMVRTNLMRFASILEQMASKYRK